MPLRKAIIRARIVVSRSLHVQGDFRIGAWLIQPQLHTIARDAQVTHVEPKAMQVLVYLAEHADQVVPKERLISAVWTDTFVTDDVLIRCISELRKAFDEDAKDPKVIGTIPRGGYRLVAPVVPVAPEETKAAATAKPQPRASLSRAGLGAVFALLVLLAGAAVYWTLFSPRAHPPAGRIMLAVLPFQNLSGDPEQEYFSDGLTAEMISQLGRLPPEQLGVIARTSAIQYKNTKKSAAEIGRELGADYLVEGSVQRAGERVRIRTELVKVRDQTHLWAETYERNLRDILTLQAEVSNAIAGEIRIKLTPQEEARLATARPLNPQAHEAYLRALYSFYQGRNQGTSQTYNRYFSQSIEQYQEAIRLDPGYPQAYAGLARAYHWLASGLEVQQADLPAKSRQAAEKALALDERLAEAHAALGYVAFRFEWDFPRAEQEFRRAIELNPNYEEAHEGYGMYLSTVGRITDAFSELNLVRELDPANLSFQETLALLCTSAGQYDRAIGILQSLLATQPNAADFHEDLVTAFIEKGEVAQGLEEARRAVQLAPDEPGKRATLVFAEAASGDRIAARKTLGELNELSRTKTVSPVLLARAHAALGENDRALELLGAAVARRDSDLIYFKCDDPMLRPLQADPRCRAVMRQTGLPE